MFKKGAQVLHSEGTVGIEEEIHLVEFDFKRLLNWRLALVLVALVALPFVNAADLTAGAIQPLNYSNFTATGAAIDFTVNCSAAVNTSNFTNVTVYLLYMNASFYGRYSNTSDITNDTNFNISTASGLPLYDDTFVWFVNCEDNNTAVNSSVLTFHILTTPFLTSVLSSPIDGSAQTVADVISLTGWCESNATLMNGRFFVYRSTGAYYASYANISVITNATAFSVPFTVPIEATTWYWNLQCFDNHYQNANASANYSFTAASGTSSGSSGTGCTANSDCSSGYYCSNSVCVACNIAADGICRTCAVELGLTDPDCEEEATPTAQPTAAPTQEPEPTQTPAVEPTQAPATEPAAEPTQAPVEDGVTYEEAIAEIEEAQSMQGASTNDEAQELIGLAMAALEDGEFEQAKAYAQQAQTLLLSTSVPEEEVQAGFDWTLPALLLIVVVGAIVYFGTKKKEGL
jgi:hypothetical protein